MQNLFYLEQQCAGRTSRLQDERCARCTSLYAPRQSLNSKYASGNQGIVVSLYSASFLLPWQMSCNFVSWYRKSSSRISTNSNGNGLGRKNHSNGNCNAPSHNLCNSPRHSGPIMRHHWVTCWRCSTWTKLGTTVVRYNSRFFSLIMFLFG